MGIGERVGDLVVSPVAGTGQGIWTGAKWGAGLTGALTALTWLAIGATVAFAPALLGMVGVTFLAAAAPTFLVVGIGVGLVGALVGGAVGLAAGGVGGGYAGGVIGLLGGIGQGIHRFFAGRDHSAPSRDPEIQALQQEAAGIDARNAALRERLSAAGGFDNPDAQPGHVEKENAKALPAAKEPPLALPGGQSQSSAAPGR